MTQRIKVSTDEVTCTECGETFPARWCCPRCGRQTPTVPTISYLRKDEYEMTNVMQTSMPEEWQYDTR